MQCFIIKFPILFTKLRSKYAYHVHVLLNLSISAPHKMNQTYVNLRYICSQRNILSCYNISKFAQSHCLLCLLSNLLAYRQSIKIYLSKPPPHTIYCTISHMNQYAQFKQSHIRRSWEIELMMHRKLSLLFTLYYYLSFCTIPVNEILFCIFCFERQNTCQRNLRATLLYCNSNAFSICII